MTNENWLWLLVVVGGPCVIAIILILICIIRRRRARYLGVLPQRQYSFPVSGLFFSSSQNRDSSNNGHLPLTQFETDSLDDLTSRDSVNSLPATNGFIIPSKRAASDAPLSD